RPTPTLSPYTTLFRSWANRKSRSAWGWPVCKQAQEAKVTSSTDHDLPAPEQHPAEPQPEHAPLPPWVQPSPEAKAEAEPAKEARSEEHTSELQSLAYL